jgi:signal transduction histidine kinase
VVLEVHNEGAAIPDSARERIFEPLERSASAHDTRKNLGLGLYIARLISEAHGGAIKVDSSPRDGTTFTVCLPRHHFAAGVTLDRRTLA